MFLDKYFMRKRESNREIVSKGGLKKEVKYTRDKMFDVPDFINKLHLRFVK